MATCSWCGKNNATHFGEGWSNCESCYLQRKKYAEVLNIKEFLGYATDIESDWYREGKIRGGMYIEFAVEVAYRYLKEKEGKDG